MNIDDFDTIIVIFVIVVCGLGVGTCTLSEIRKGKVKSAEVSKLEERIDMQKEAIAAGVATWKSDTNGEPIFVWGVER